MLQLDHCFWTIDVYSPLVNIYEHICWWPNVYFPSFLLEYSPVWSEFLFFFFSFFLDCPYAQNLSIIFETLLNIAESSTVLPLYVNALCIINHKYWIFSTFCVWHPPGISMVFSPPSMSLLSFIFMCLLGFLGYIPVYSIRKCRNSL